MYLSYAQCNVGSNKILTSNHEDKIYLHEIFKDL